LPLPSYFCAISFRWQANKVSAVTMVATSARSLYPKPLALAANRRLVVVESHSPPAELLAKNPALLVKVIDDLQLVLSTGNCCGGNATNSGNASAEGKPKNGDAHGGAAGLGNLSIYEKARATHSRDPFLRPLSE
jgi:hypothetical protein